VRGSEGVSRILVVELWNIGDVVLTIPFLTQLRAVFPNARITLLGQPHARVILEGTTLVDEYIETDLAWTRTGPFDPFAYHWRAFMRTVLELRRRKFDVAFQSRKHVRERVLLALSGARRRVGYADQPDGSADRHKSDEWLDLLAGFGGAGDRLAYSRLKVSESERAWTEAFLFAHGVSSSDVVVGIHPGASVPKKRWPLERFREATRFVAQQPGVRPLVFVDPSGYGAALGEVDGVISAKVDLRRMMALLKRCDVLLCNDSGPMHLAGALGVPTVAVFGSGIRRLFAPLGDGHELVTATHECGSARPYDVSEVPTSEVLDAIERALRKGTANA
jgi:lipopolysaccharide heptosyltransferase II